MHDLGSSLSGGQRAATSMSEKIEHFHSLPSACSGAHLLDDPFPIRRLLGKDADVSKIGRLQLESQWAKGDGPAPWQRIDGNPTSALAAPLIAVQLESRRRLRPQFRL